jgi:hypothetical protein
MYLGSVSPRWRPTLWSDAGRAVRKRKRMIQIPHWLPPGPDDGCRGSSGTHAAAPFGARRYCFLRRRGSPFGAPPSLLMRHRTRVLDEPSRGQMGQGSLEGFSESLCQAERRSPASNRVCRSRRLVAWRLSSVPGVELARQRPTRLTSNRTANARLYLNNSPSPGERVSEISGRDRGFYVTGRAAVRPRRDEAALGPALPR